MSDRDPSTQNSQSRSSVHSGYHLPTYHFQSSYNDQTEPGGDRRSFVGFGGHPGFFGAPDTSQATDTAMSGGGAQSSAQTSQTIPRKPVGTGSTAGTSG